MLLSLWRGQRGNDDRLEEIIVKGDADQAPPDANSSITPIKPNKMDFRFTQ
jgi:hypothetical protein